MFVELFFAEHLQDVGITKGSHKIRNLQLLDHLLGGILELFDGENVLLVSNEGMKKLLKETTDAGRTTRLIF